MIKDNFPKYATVDELILILQRLSSEGLGDAIVGCNKEYYLSKPTYEEERPQISTGTSGKKYIDLGGYC